MLASEVEFNIEHNRGTSGGRTLKKRRLLHLLNRFGTEGSEVRILSPRPIFLRKSPNLVG